MKAFLLKNILFTLGLSLFILVWNNLLAPNFKSPEVWFILLFFFGSISLVHYLLLRSEGKRPTFYVQFFMGATVFRTFIYIGIIALYAMNYKASAKIFIINFLLLYFLFTVFEIITVRRFFRRDDSSAESSH